MFRIKQKKLNLTVFCEKQRKNSKQPDFSLKFKLACVKNKLVKLI